MVVAAVSTVRSCRCQASDPPENPQTPQGAQNPEPRGRKRRERRTRTVLEKVVCATKMARALDTGRWLNWLLGITNYSLCKKLNLSTFRGGDDDGDGDDAAVDDDDDVIDADEAVCEVQDTPCVNPSHQARLGSPPTPGSAILMVAGGAPSQWMKPSSRHHDLPSPSPRGN